MTRAELVAWLERNIPADGVIDSIEFGIATAQIGDPSQLVAGQGVDDARPEAWGVRERSRTVQAQSRAELLAKLGPLAPVGEELLRRMAHDEPGCELEGPDGFSPRRPVR